MPLFQIGGQAMLGASLPTPCTSGAGMHAFMHVQRQANRLAHHCEPFTQCSVVHCGC